LDPPQHWPGRFIGLRAGVTGGQATVPKLKADALTATGTDGVTVIAPSLGVDLGYAQKEWGTAVVFELAPVGTMTLFTAGIQLMYVPNDMFRVVFGIDPYVRAGTSVSTGAGVTSGGLGARLGAHMRLTEMTDEDGETAPKIWEGFAYLSYVSFGSFTGHPADGGDSQDLDKSTLLPSSPFTGMISATVGIQVNFSFK
jgi:hypothetical protein